MASSYQDRLKARRGGRIQEKKPTTQLKLNDKRKIRGKTVYWNPYTKSWSKTRVFKKQPNDKNTQLRKKNVNAKSEEKLKIIRKARKEGTAPDFGDLRGTATKKQPNNGKSNKTDKPTNTESTETVEEKKDQSIKTEEKKTPQTETETSTTEKKDPLRAKPKYIKKKKGKGFVSTKSVKGKQLLKIEERKRKLREKRFGKK